MEKLENGKYLFCNFRGKAYIVRTEKDRKNKTDINSIAKKFIDVNNINKDIFPENFDEVLYNYILKNSSFVELENKTGYISLRSKCFGGAYQREDFINC